MGYVTHVEKQLVLAHGLFLQIHCLAKNVNQKVLWLGTTKLVTLCCLSTPLSRSRMFC